jgi:hypothetical protein
LRPHKLSSAPTESSSKSFCTTFYSLLFRNTMAPNRKSVINLELPIAAEALENVVQVKFLPLTDPREQEQHEQQQRGQAHIPKQCKVQDTASYWDWPANTQEEEKLETLFSTARIESNLVEDGKKYELSTRSQVAAHDDYWAESSSSQSEVIHSTMPQHVSDAYWSWPANRNLHNEELAERLTSTRHIESNLKAFRAPPASSIKQQHDSYWTWSAEAPHRQQKPLPNKSQSDEYWTWNCLSKEDEKQQLIQSILQYERARQLLTADHIEKQLVANATKLQESSMAVATAAIPSSGYWDW